MKSVYYRDLHNTLAGLSNTISTSKLLVQFGDERVDNDYPTLIKTRDINHSNETIDYKSIVFKLDSNRHWGFKFQIDKYDVPWTNKTNNVIWRGAYYGNDNTNPRYRLINNYGDKYNIKNTERAKHFKCTNEFNSALNGIFKYICKFDILSVLDNIFLVIKLFITFNFIEHKSPNHISQEDQLKCKYLINIEGNDVSTALKWMMYSNSVVIMPKPTVASWFMEDCLEPYVHYVPLNDEIDNLDEIINWCKNNDNTCKEIAHNATIYTKSFLNISKENEIMNGILKQYYNNIKFIN
jgi:hypothetical protein